MGKTKMAVMDDSITEVPKAGKVSKVSKEKDQLSVLSSQLSDASLPVVSESVSETDPPAGGPKTDQPESENRKPKTENRTKSSKRAQKKGKAKYRSAKYKEAAEKVEKSKKYPLTEAIDAAKASSYSKFDGSLEIHLGTSVKNIRGLVSLPFASGKKLKILAFGKGAENSGADLIGDDAKLNEIIRGVTSSFDVIVTTAEWMPKLARAAKILGPRGLMPSPKNGTITEDLKKAVTEIQSGKVEYKTEKAAQVIHLPIGKVSQATDQVSANIKILFNAIGKTKIKKITLSPSMGMGVKVDLASI